MELCVAILLFFLQDDSFKENVKKCRPFSVKGYIFIYTYFIGIVSPSLYVIVALSMVKFLNRYVSVDLFIKIVRVITNKGCHWVTG